jgi:hypothetical protein
MSDIEKAIVRDCLREVLLNMEEAREIPNWWKLLSETNRQEWKDFNSLVMSFRSALTKPDRADGAVT